MDLRSQIELIEKLEAERQRREGRNNPVAFAKLVGINPDPWQEEVLLSKSSRIILNCCRQMGKSTVISIMALHQAIYWPDQTIILISPKQSQSMELIEKIQKFITRLPVRAEVSGEAMTSIRFANRSRILSVAATENMRGYSANLVIEDEAGDVDDSLMASILPMVGVTKGRMCLSGTPKGRSGHFFEIWERGGKSWERYEIPVSLSTRHDAMELMEQRLILRDKYPQEYECQFISGGQGMVYGAFDEMTNLIPTLPQLLPNQKWEYLLGLDFGVVDSTAFSIIAWRAKDPTCYVVESFKEAKLLPNEVGDKVRELEKIYKFSRIIGDAGGLGKAYTEELRRRFLLPVEPADKQNKRGYIDLINGAMASGQLQFVKSGNTALIAEMTSLPWHSSGLKEHPGFENHLTDATLYGWRACSTYAQVPDKPKLRQEPSAMITSEVNAFWDAHEQSRNATDEHNLVWGIDE